MDEPFDADVYVPACPRPLRFGEIRDAMGISPKVLSDTPLGLTPRDRLGAVRHSADTHVHDIVAARKRHDQQA